MTRQVCGAAALLSLAVGYADGQVPSADGDLVRVHLGGDQLQGSLVSWDSAGLALQLRVAEQAAADTLLTWTDVDRVERYAGTKSHTGTGALIGAGVGVAVFAVLLATQRCWGDGCEEGVDLGTVIVVGGAIIGGLGAGLGALIGSQAKTERWEQVPLPASADGVSWTRGGSVECAATVTVGAKRMRRVPCAVDSQPY